MSRRCLTVRHDSLPIRGSFCIARGAKTSAEVVVAEISAQGLTGRGEAVPYGRYGETVEGVIAALEASASAVAAGGGREHFEQAIPAGAARNALDCALWDLEAKLSGQPVWRLAGLSRPPQPVTTAYTLSLDRPEAMAAAAAALADWPLIKLKLGHADDDLARVQAVRTAAPRARLIADANEGWRFEQLVRLAPALAALGLEMIEQPLPAGDDDALFGFESPVPLCADESCHGPDSLERLRGRYQMINIKLDKTGGLTGALRLKAAAEAAGFAIMVGCMVASSLAMAPALLVAQNAQVVDLDGPLLLMADRSPALLYKQAEIAPPDARLWG